MPVPRRFDRRPPERDLTRINERIRVPEVRLIGEDGAQIGVLKIADALTYAQERDLDLVEVAPEAKPPVCRVLDYSKYRYEQAQKLKQARKHQQQITIREIKFRPKIAQHDYDTKKGHVERFLRHRDKVKITIMFRGREVTHPERGVMILDRLALELAELAVVEQRPLQDGRNMTMLLGPSKAVLAGQLDGAGAIIAPEDGEVAAATNGEVAVAAGSAAGAPTEVAPNGQVEAAEEVPVPAAAVELPVEAPVEVPEEAPVDTPAAEVVASSEGDGAAGEAVAAAAKAPAKKPRTSAGAKTTAKAKTAPKRKPAEKPAAAKAAKPKPAAKPPARATKPKAA